MMVMTPTVYADRPILRVSWQVISATGVTKISRSGMSVTMTVEGTDISCNNRQNGNTGVANNDCYYTFLDDQFSDTHAQTSVTKRDPNQK